MEEMDMTVSEHYCCSGGGYGTDPKEATYVGTLPQYLGFAQDGQITEDKEDDTELDSHSEDEDTHHAVYITAGGKEGFGKEPDQMDGGHNDGVEGAPGCSIKVPTTTQMRARTAACGKRIDIRKHLAHEAIKNGHLMTPHPEEGPDHATAGGYHDQGCEATQVHGWAARQAALTLRRDSRGSGGGG